MANLWVTLNSQKLFPALPLDRVRSPVRDTLDMAAGNRRFYHRASKRRWTLTRPKASEAIRTTWLAAAVESSSLPFIDLEGTSYTVVVMSFADPISKTTPTTGQAGSATATGTPLYDLTIELEEV
jgi:hypothetical protein